MFIFRLSDIVTSYVYWFYYWNIRHKKISRFYYLGNILYLLFCMNRSYSDYIDIIDKVEKIEQVVITDNKTKNAAIIH